MPAIHYLFSIGAPTPKELAGIEHEFPCYVIINAKTHFTGAEELIETWIYFKEFKSQLHHYMNLHRSIWTQIEAIKEERYIQGRQVKAQRAKLESYKKTIELIE